MVVNILTQIFGMAMIGIKMEVDVVAYLRNFNLGAKFIEKFLIILIILK